MPYGDVDVQEWISNEFIPSLDHICYFPTEFPGEINTTTLDASLCNSEVYPGILLPDFLGKILKFNVKNDLTSGDGGGAGGFSAKLLVSVIKLICSKVIRSLSVSAWILSIFRNDEVIPTVSSCILPELINSILLYIEVAFLCFYCYTYLLHMYIYF